MTNKRIALVMPAIESNADLIERFLAQQNIASDYFQQAQEAIDRLSQTTYPLIVTALEIAPGDEIKDPDIQEAWNTPCFGLECESYANVGLGLLKAIRKTQANRTTEIIVADTFKAEKDLFYGNVEKRCLEAGATTYFPLRMHLEQRDPLNALIKEIVARVS